MWSRPCEISQIDCFILRNGKRRGETKEQECTKYKNQKTNTDCMSIATNTSNSYITSKRKNDSKTCSCDESNHFTLM